MAGPRLNKVFLIGNLTRDPELRYTSNGIAVADLGLAVNDDYQRADGTRVERVCYVDVTVWGRTAETSCEYLSKGRSVLVEGRLRMDTWETGDGQKRTKLRVTADRVQFLGGPPRSGEERPAPPGTASPPPVEPEPEVPAETEEPPTDLPPEDDEIPF